jgi:flagellar biosynthesis protein FlhG
MIQQGDNLIFKAKNSVFTEVYKTTAISVDDDFIYLEVPMFNGQPVLPKEGTMFYLFNQRTREEHITELVEKQISPEMYLKIKKPFYKKGNRTKFISVASGKGGVGKTSFSINLAVALSQKGYNTFLLDADMGMANVDILMNLRSKYTIKDIIDNDINILETVLQGPGGVNVIPGGSGFKDLANIDIWKFNKLINSFNDLEKFADFVIIDTGAGIANNVINFLLASNEVLVITTPEPHSITDAYALIKTIDETDPGIMIKLIINKVESPEEANFISSKIINVAKQNLKIKILKYGFIMEDLAVSRAVKKRRPFMISEFDSPASQCVENISNLIINKPYSEPVLKKSFSERLKEVFNR